MAASVFELSLLLTLRDMASAGLGRFEDRLRALGPDSRHALEDFRALQAGMQRGLAIGGAGVATLALLKKGVDAAADYETAVTDMRVAFTETGRDGAAEMNKLTTLAERLGAALPGTTTLYTELFTALKQGGLDTNTILDGAGEAVANLAVTMKRVPKELADPFAAFGQQFGLKGQDFVKLADLMSRARAATGIMPEEIIMASKYAQLRGGQSLGFKGLEGAQTITQLLTLLRRQGMSGESAGTNLSALFRNLTLDRSKDQIGLVKDLATRGIKLEFFDVKGSFKGVENMMAQMEKLRGLSQADQISTMRVLFEQEGAGVANIFMNAGQAGLKASNDELARKIGLQKEINEQTQTYNAKMEALKGTLDNIKAITFTPMLDTLKPMLDMANKAASALQDFSKAHPGVTGLITEFWGLIGVGMVLTGTLKTVSAAARIVNLLSLAADAGAAAGGVGRLGLALGKLPGSVQVTLLLATVGFTLSQITEFIHTVDEFNKANDSRDKITQSSVAAYGKARQSILAGGDAVPLNMARGQAETVRDRLNREGQLNESLEGTGVAAVLRKTFNIGPKSQAVDGPMDFLGKYSGLLFGATPIPLIQRSFRDVYGAATGRDTQTYAFAGTSETSRADYVRKSAPQLQFPEVMAAYRQQVYAQPNVAPDAKAWVDSTLQKAFPESFAASAQQFAASLQAMTQQQQAAQQVQLQQAQASAQQQALMAQSLAGIQQGMEALPPPLAQTQQNLLSLAPPMTQTQQNFSALAPPVEQTKNAFSGLAPAATNAVAGLDAFNAKLGSWTPPAAAPGAAPAVPGAAQFFTPTPGGSGIPVIQPPPKASGGRVLADGLAYIHSGEAIVPARVTARWQDADGPRLSQPERVTPIAFPRLAEPERAAPLNFSSVTEPERVTPFDFSSSAEPERVASAASFASRAETAPVSLTNNAGAGVTLHYAPNITINGGDGGGERNLGAQLAAHSREIERIVSGIMRRRRELA